MFEIRIQVTEGNLLTLDEMAGNMVLAGEDRTDILFRSRDGREEDLSVEETATGPVISAPMNCEIRVPSSVQVSVRQVAGNLRAKGLAELNAEQVRGNLRLQAVARATLAEVYGNLRVDETDSLRVVGTVYGDAHLKAVPAIDIQNVRGNMQVKAADQARVSRTGGNLQAREIRGSLNADKIGGNAHLRGIGGTLSLDQVAGNLVVKDLCGGAKVGRVGGNLVWNGTLGAGCTYHFRADGNATLRLDEDTNAHLTLKAKGNLHIPTALTVVQRDGSTLSGTLGDGSSEIVVEAKGNVLLGGGQPGIGADLGEEISRQVEEGLQAIDLEAIGRQVGEEMEAAMSRLRVKLEDVDWERVGHQAEQAVELAMDRMQRDMDRMVGKAAQQQEKVERKAEKEARRRARQERKARREGQEGPESKAQDLPVETAYKAAEPEPELDDERLSILRMVEQGQINPEEAEMLLDALR